MRPMSESEKQLCAFIAGLDVAQFARLMNELDFDTSAKILRHIDGCLTASPQGECTKVYNEYEAQEDKKADEEWEKLSEEEKYRLALGLEAMIRELGPILRDASTRGRQK